MRRVLKKSFYIAIILIISLLTITAPVNATHLQINSITPNNNGGLAEKSEDIAGIIIAVAQVIGITVAIVILIVVAIKYLQSSPNDRAEIKKHAVVYIVGAVLLFATSGLLGIIREFAKNLGGE